MLNDKVHRHYLKDGEKIFKTYKSNPMDILKVLHDDHLVFHVRSESFSDTSYNVLFSIHYCNCPDSKHPFTNF